MIFTALMQNRKFSKQSWAFLSTFMICLLLGKALCACASHANRVTPRKKSSGLLTPKDLPELYIDAPEQWPYMYWEETPLIAPVRLYLKDNIEITELNEFLSVYTPGEILKGNTFDELSELNRLYQNYKNSVGESSKMSRNSLTDYIVKDTEMAKESVNTGPASFIQKIIKDFSEKFQEFFKTDVKLQHFTIIAVCTEIPEGELDYLDSMFPKEDDCLIPRDAVALKYNIIKHNSMYEGIIIIDPLGRPNKVYMVNELKDGKYPYYQKVFDQSAVFGKELLYYLNRPAVTEITLKVNSIHSLKRIVAYTWEIMPIAEVSVTIGYNPKVKIYATGLRQTIEFLLNGMEFKKTTRPDDSDGIQQNIITLNSPSLKDDICQVCGRNNQDFQNDDDKCQEDHCLTMNIIQFVEKIFWPESNGQTLIEILFDLKEVINDTYFMTAIAAINKKKLIRMIQKEMASKKAEEQLLIDNEKRTATASEAPLSPTQMTEKEASNDSSEATEKKNKGSERVSELYGEAVSHFRRIRGTHLTAALVVVIPIICVVLVKIHRSRKP